MQGISLPVEVLASCGSTNTELLGPDGEDFPVLLLAEEQTAGRGRRGRRWHASPGAALMFSLRWPLPAGVGGLAGLSLAAGVAIAQALRALGAAGIALKWPNDLLASADRGGGKLGGILVETRSKAGRTTAVIGVGLNCRRMPGLDTRLKRAIASLDEAFDVLPPRNAIASGVAGELVRALHSFETDGFIAFKDAWESMHAHQGALLKVRTTGGHVFAGIADGIAPDGGLLLRNRRGVRSIHSGTVVRGAASRDSAA